MENHPATLATGSTIPENDRRNHLGEKALHLRIVEEFLTQMEFTLLKCPAEQFNFDAIKGQLQQLKDIAGDENADRRKRVEFQLAHELHLWREYLAERDLKIEAYHIRRYCDGLKKALDPEIFVALGRFYRELPISKNSLSKFDLAMTRAFSSQTNDARRQLTMDRADIAARIAELYTTWDREPIVSAGSNRDASAFDRFQSEGAAIANFRAMTQSRLFDRIREYKAEIGDRFFHPLVTAAAIECNINVGNRLNELMALANDSLGERLGSEFDFAGAFQDTSANAGTYIADAIRQIGTTGSLADSKSADLDFLRSLMELAGTVAESQNDGGGGEQPREVEPAAFSIEKPEFVEILALLNQNNPPTAAMLARLDNPEIGNLDVSDFLFDESDAPDALGREVLAKILTLEELRANELNEKKELPVEVRRKVMQILAAAEGLGKKIDEDFDAKGPSAARRLIVSNKLLEARLRAERAVVKFTSRGLGLAPAPVVEEPVVDLDAPSTFSYLNYGTFAANRWVVGATVAVALICGYIYFSVEGVKASLPEDVEIIEIEKVPGAENFTGAHRQAGTLYVVAADSWRQLADEKKTNLIKNLASDTRAKQKIETVVVVNPDGQLVGELTETGVQLMEVQPVRTGRLDY